MGRAYADGYTVYCENAAPGMRVTELTGNAWSDTDRGFNYTIGERVNGDLIGRGIEEDFSALARNWSVSVEVPDDE
jgi:hypothetical protein